MTPMNAVNDIGAAVTEDRCLNHQLFNICLSNAKLPRTVPQNTNQKKKQMSAHILLLLMSKKKKKNQTVK